MLHFWHVLALLVPWMSTVAVNAAAFGLPFWLPWQHAVGARLALPQEQRAASSSDQATLASTDQALFHAPLGASLAQLEAGRQHLRELESSQDPCLLDAFHQMQLRCDHLSKDQRTRLAIQWLNCQRSASHFPPLACGPDMSIGECMAHMDKEDFTQYNLFFLKVSDVCMALANDVFRAQVEASVQRLYVAGENAQRVASQAHKDLDRLREQLTDLRSAMQDEYDQNHRTVQAQAAEALHQWERMHHLVNASMSIAVSQSHQWQHEIERLQTQWLSGTENLVGLFALHVNQSLRHLDTELVRAQGRARTIADGMERAQLRQQHLHGLQQDQLDALDASMGAVDAMEKRLHHMTGALATAGITLHALLRVAQRLLFLTVALLFGLAVAGACGSPLWHAWAVWAWYVALDIVTVLTEGPWATPPVQQQLLQWAPAMVWFFAGLNRTASSALVHSGKLRLWGRQDDDVVLRRLLIDYIVSLRIHGPAAAVPPALLAFVSQPPPAYNLNAALSPTGGSMPFAVASSNRDAEPTSEELDYLVAV